MWRSGGAAERRSGGGAARMFAAAVYRQQMINQSTMCVTVGNKFVPTTVFVEIITWE